MSVDPRLRVLYLAAVAIGAFFVKDARIAAGLLGAHMVAWILLDHGLRALVRQIGKLWGFTLLVIGSYAVTSDGPDVDRWVKVDLFGWHPSVNVGGAMIGGLMVLRVLTVVLASRIARTGDSRAIALGLGKLGAPPIVATSMDAVLALVGEGGRGRGGGGGGGGGRGRGGGGGGRAHGEEEGFWAGLKRLGRGDVGPIADRIERQIARAEAYVEEHGNVSRERARDIAVIAGLSLTMLGIKALKILPSIPFAPGHKLVLLTPLYVVASLKTRTRAGSTLTGLVMGTVAFLLGDGRYGIFEILKHLTPGILCDLMVPLLVRGGRSPGALTWSVVGGVMGVGRFATIFVVTLAVQAPAVAWAILVPGLIVHTTFGVLSGLVSAPLIRAVVVRTREREAAELAEPAPQNLETPTP